MQVDKNNRRCIKFSGYVYLPGDTGQEITWNNLRDAAMKTRGRVTIFDKDNRTVVGGSAKPFNSLGYMAHLLEQEKVRRISTRVPTAAQKKRCKKV